MVVLNIQTGNIFFDSMNTMEIYSNLVNNIIRVNHENVAEKLFIFDLSEKKITTLYPISNTINISFLEGGIYIVEIVINGERVQQQLIIEDNF